MAGRSRYKKSHLYRGAVITVLVSHTNNAGKPIKNRHERRKDEATRRRALNKFLKMRSRKNAETIAANKAA